MHRHEISQSGWERIEHLLPGRPGDAGITAADNRLFINADHAFVHQCTICKNEATFNEETGTVYCNFCEKYDTALVVPEPRAYTLWKKEAQAVGWTVKNAIRPAAY